MPVGILENLAESGAQLSLLSMIHLELGEGEMADELLIRAYHENDAGLEWVSEVPTFDVLRKEQRFISILEGMNLPAAWK